VSDLLCLGPAHAGSLLVNMSRLWELVVRRLSWEASVGEWKENETWGVIRVIEDGHRPRTFRPDAFLKIAAKGGGVRVLPVDAKYKDYRSEPVDRNDAHQLLTYASAYASPGDRSTAVLVHPTTGPNSRRTLQARAAVGHVSTIDIVGVCTGNAPAEAARHLQMSIHL
jgi:5-methylcytosine-specific restriction endonuclease McrBC regulatory subunit McrC